MSNVLSTIERVRVLSALVEGNSLRATERLTGIFRQAITRLLLAVGDGCERLHDGMMRELPCSLLELDEIWTFVRKKEAHVFEDDPPKVGDAYTFIALDATSKLIAGFLVGKRVQENFTAFARDLRARVVGRPQLSTDGHKSYIEAVEEAFGSKVHFAQIIKEYQSDEAGGASRDDVRYSRGRVKTCLKIVRQGSPDEDKISTSFVERGNLTLRMSQRRFTRLTNAFSKCLRNLRAAVALYVCHYNFCRVHMTLRVTPAMEAGLTDHVWSLEELLTAALSAPEALPLPSPAAPVLSPRRPGPVRTLPGQLPLRGVS